MNVSGTSPLFCPASLRSDVTEQAIYPIQQKVNAKRLFLLNYIYPRHVIINSLPLALRRPSATEIFIKK